MSDALARISDGARAIAARFDRCVTAREHLAIVDEARTRHQIMWVRKHAKDVWGEILKPAIDASWERGYPQGARNRALSAEVVRQGKRDARLR